MSDASMAVYTAADINEGDEIQGLLAEAGIASTLEPVAGSGAGGCRVLVAVHHREAALDALAKHVTAASRRG